MSVVVGYARTGTVSHLVRLDRAWYSGITAFALCGVKALRVTDDAAGTAAGWVQPAGTCKRCAATLGQTVRKL